MERVQSYWIQSESTRVQNPNVFSPQKGKGYWWIQRLCFWLLEKIGAYHFDDKVSIKQFTIDFDDIVEAVVKQEQLVYQISRERPRYLVLGHAQYRKLMGATESMMMFQARFPENFNARIYPKEYQGMFQGMELLLIPWIDGMFVLPELKR
jgi:hypothetical protein